MSVIVNNLHFGYIKQPLCLTGVSFSVNKNEVVGIVGGLGSGKTSLLRVLCKQEDQFFGDVKINGKDIKQISIQDLGVSYLPATPVLFENKSIYKNIEYLYSVQNKPMIEEEKLKESLLKFGLNLELKTKVKKLTGCQKKLLCIARSYLKNANILLIDDIFDGETQENINKLKTAIQTLIFNHNASKTVILALNSGIALDLCNKFVYLSYGKSREIKTIDNLKACNIDLFVSNYFDFEKEEFKLIREEQDYFLLKTEFVKINKKQIQENITHRIKLAGSFNELLDKLCLEANAYINVALLAREQINIENDRLLNDALQNKKIAMFESDTGVKII